jgi:exonuclease SbcC
MIPLSVRMTGWMRYRDEEVADFTGGSLISICGENGAGKSSIFDAITYALYGQHRLGKMHAEQLISQDVDRLSVEFEFEAGGQRYLVRRSRGRKESERDQSLWIADGIEWTQVPGTEKDDALRRSLDAIVRLSYEAFTSSFMLQQGAATSFLDADPQPRFAIISSLIGLKEYERLEKAAREAQKREKGRLDDITQKLGEFEGVDADAIERLRSDAAAAATRDADAATALDAARLRLADAQRYTRLIGELGALDAQIAETDTLLADKEAIEKEAELFATLATAAGTLERIQSAVADADRANAAAAAATKDAAAIDTETLAAAHSTAAAAFESMTEMAAAAERSHAGAQTAERSASDFAQFAAAITDGRDRATEIDRGIAAYNEQIDGIAASQAEYETSVATAKAAVDAADAALEVARVAAAACTARVESQKRQLAERKAAAREATCAHCGQPIDKKLAKQQIEEMTAQLAESQSGATDATKAEKAQVGARAAASKHHDELDREIAKEIQRLNRIQGERAAAMAEQERTTTLLAELEARLGGRIGDVASAATAAASARQHLSQTEAAVVAARGEHDRARRSEEAARTELEDGRRRRAALEAAAREQAATADGHRKQARAFASGLGALGDEALADPAAVLAVVHTQQTALAGAPERKVALDRAIKDHTAWTAQRDVKRVDIETIPELHRVDEREARDAESAAATDSAAAREAVHVAQQRLTMLEARIDELDRLVAEKQRAESRQKLLKKLTKLLGKSGLQGALVTDALATITSHANAFLQRLTGGTLQLRIHRGEGDSLDLQAIDMTCMREARSVRILSGSQKFRCAVAIASGIGQYAGAGGMRSIVIDEGFGSLDQAGQQSIVEELKQLATHMDKVIVVSHLEAFTNRDNFPDQLIVESTGTTSRIRRVF